LSVGRDGSSDGSAEIVLKLPWRNNCSIVCNVAAAGNAWPSHCGEKMKIIEKENMEYKEVFLIVLYKV